MTLSLQDFLKSIESLLDQLNFENESRRFYQKIKTRLNGETPIELEVKSFLTDVVGNSISQAKVYTYKTAIICLYGYLERYVEECIAEYLTEITGTCQSYELLPNEIRKQHLGLSLDLINRIQKSKGHTPQSRKLELANAVRNMNSFLDENSSGINISAFTSHTANFRYDSIHDIFKRIGINDISRKCIKDNQFTSELCIRNSIQAEANTTDKIYISLLTSELDDLAQRRNEVAHGVRIDTIESLDITIARINLIREYVRAMDRVIEGELNNLKFTTLPKLNLGTPNAVFPKLKVIGFSCINTPFGKPAKIKPGDAIYIKNTHTQKHNISGKIISLFKNNLNENEITIPCNDAFTIGLNIELPNNLNNYSVYVVTNGIN